MMNNNRSKTKLHLSSRRRKRTDKYLRRWREKKRVEKYLAVNIPGFADPLPNENNKEVYPFLTEIQINSGNENVVDRTLLDNYTKEEEMKTKHKTKEERPQGRRIVDINYLFTQIQSEKHSGGLGCTFMEMEYVKEERRGFSSRWLFKCKMCNVTMWLRSEYSQVPINTSIVKGAMGIGAGFRKLRQLTADACNIPCMSHTAFLKEQKNLTETVQEAAREPVEESIIEEKFCEHEASNIDFIELWQKERDSEP